MTLVSAAAGAVGAQDKADGAAKAGKNGPFQPTWDSLKTHRDPEWFRDAKFGIYTHWGPVTVGSEDCPCGGQWYGNEMYSPKSGVFAWHKQHFGDQTKVGYKDLIPKFKAEKFDAEAWADLFARSGAKFAGPVAVHHDNFAMWDSAVTPWNAAKMGPRRDVVGELERAIKRRGLKFITTFHHGFAWRYFEPSFAFDGADPRYAFLYTEAHKPGAPPSQAYLDRWLGMVNEVLGKYQPDMIWFDFELMAVITPEYQRRMFADYYNWAARNHRDSAVAHKFREIHEHTGILDFERGREDRLVPYPWLTDTALAEWFNNKAAPYRSMDNFVQVLVDIVSKNGCMLLDVSPAADGTIPEQARKMLLGMGDWLAVNGEAIYGTRPWLVYGEGPTKGKGGGFSEQADKSFAAKDIRFTTKGPALYAIALGWPTDGKLLIKSLASDAGKVSAVSLLGHSGTLAWSQGEQGLEVTLPAKKPCKHAFALKILGAGLKPSPAAKRPGNGAAESIKLQNDAGLVWELSKNAKGWGLGRLSLHGKAVEHSMDNGVLSLRNVKSGAVRWLAASEVKQIDARTARLIGKEEVEGATFKFDVTLSLEETMPAARITPAWSVDKDLDGWEVCLAYHDGFTSDWRVQSYPWAGNSETAVIAPMRYCGVPGALLYRPDQALVVLFAIDSNSDYLNPGTWTGRTGFHFANRRVAPQFRAGGGKLKAGLRYELPWQLVLSDAGEFAAAITHVMQAWVKLNDYRVDDSLRVRTPQEAFKTALEGRRQMPIWKPGIGYEHHRGAPFVYVGNNPYIAYFEYRLYEITGDRLWRERAFQQIAFALRGQQPSGVFHTSWYMEQGKTDPAQGFCSRDWGHDGYKTDINAWMDRYLLQTWQRVKEKEGIDRQDWYKAAVRSLDWVRSQQNADGGLPQCVDIQTGAKSASVVSGRALVGLPIIAKITGDDRYMKLSADLERFLRRNVEGRFWYTGMHPDLPPGDFEQDSIYAVVEYWLDKHDRTGDKESLERAVANAYYALLYWCPKQLSWVKSPTQCAHSEQEHYNQYSVYCYGNRKIQCLDRLFRKTGNPLFEQLKQRVMQLNFYVQVVDSPYRGAMTEAIADPWRERGDGFEWRGNPYTSELVADLMLQLIDLGLAR